MFSGVCFHILKKEKRVIYLVVVTVHTRLNASVYGVD